MNIIADTGNFNDETIVKCEKELLPSELSDSKINNTNSLAYSTCESHIDNAYYDIEPTYAHFQGRWWLICNIILLCTSLALFFAVMFGFVPDIAHYQLMRHELNATKISVAKCSAAHGELNIEAMELGKNLNQCSRDLAITHKDFVQCQTNLEVEVSSKNRMDMEITRLKDENAHLRTLSKLKDDTIKRQDDELQNRAARTQPDAYTGYNDASFSRSSSLILIPMVYFFVKVFV